MYLLALLSSQITCNSILARQNLRIFMLYWFTMPSSGCLRAAKLDFQRLLNCSWGVLFLVLVSPALGKPKRQAPETNLPQ